MKTYRHDSILFCVLGAALCLLLPTPAQSRWRSAAAGKRLATVLPLSRDHARRHVPARALEPYGPFPIYGPPLPRDREVNRKLALRLLAYCRSGALLLTVPERESGQLQALSEQGLYCWPVPPSGITIRSSRQQEILAGTSLDDEGRQDQHGERSISSSRQKRPLPSRGVGTNRDTDSTIPSAFDPLYKPPSPTLLRLLTTLAMHSTPHRPLELMSLLRPLYRTGAFVHVGPLNPHSLGLAADIAAYGGHRIRQEAPDECVSATLALLRDLPPGRYRLGLPKAPEVPLCVGRAPASFLLAAWLPELAEEPGSTPERPALHEAIHAAALGATLGAQRAVWPFFPSPEPLLEEGCVAPRRIAGKPVLRGGKLEPSLIRFRNEEYADAEDLNDSRLKRALEAARRHGVEIVALFPDGRDHIHVDVRQNK